MKYIREDCENLTSRAVHTFQFYGTMTIRDHLTVMKAFQYLRVQLVSLEPITGLCDDLVTM